MRKRLILLLPALFCWCVIDVGRVLAVDVNWDGDAADGAWETPANWDGDALPGSGETAVISNGDTVAFSALSGSESVSSIIVGRYGGNSGTLAVSGGSISSSGMGVGQYGGVGNLNISDGTVAVSGFTFLGDAGTGNLTISGGGTYLPGNTVWMGNGGGVATAVVSGNGVWGSGVSAYLANLTGDSSLTLSDNAVMRVNNFLLGGDGDHSVTINGNASLSIGALTIADGAGTETVNFTGGTLSATTANTDLGGAGFQVGGTLVLGGNNNNHVFTDGLDVLAGGILEIGGTVAGQAANIAGDVTLFDGATYNYSVTPTVAYDTADVNGLLKLGDISIELETLGDQPSLPEYEYVLFEFTDLYTEDGLVDLYDPGNTDAQNTALLNANVDYDFTYAPLTRVGNLNNPQLDIVGNTIVLSGFSAVNVPEPSTLLLIGLGTALLRRRIMLGILQHTA